MTPYQSEEMGKALESGKMLVCTPWFIIPHHIGLDKGYTIIQPDTGRIEALRNTNDVTWRFQDFLSFEIIDNFKVNNIMKNKVGRDEFMDFFRSDDFHEKMSVDDCHEVFSQILHGESDFTKELLEQTAGDYGVDILSLYSSEDLLNESKKQTTGFNRDSISKRVSFDFDGKTMESVGQEIKTTFKGLIDNHFEWVESSNDKSIMSHQYGIQVYVDKGNEAFLVNVEAVDYRSDSKRYPMFTAKTFNLEAAFKMQSMITSMVYHHVPENEINLMNRFGINSTDTVATFESIASLAPKNSSLEDAATSVLAQSSWLKENVSS